MARALGPTLGALARAGVRVDGGLTEDGARRVLAAEFASLAGSVGVSWDDVADALREHGGEAGRSWARRVDDLREGAGDVAALALAWQGLYLALYRRGRRVLGLAVDADPRSRAVRVKLSTRRGAARATRANRGAARRPRRQR